MTDPSCMLPAPVDYSLEHLSSRGFEQLIQSLAAVQFGSRIVIFGDGPDGGREATYSGQVRVAPEGDPWDGDLCVQAKFRQKTQGNAADQEWALKELRSELKKLKERRDAEIFAYDYYIFVTNVDLSSVEERGGKDKAYALLGDDALGLTDFDLWDYRKLCAYIDAAADVRRAYAAWLTSGDVLTAMMDHISRGTPDFASTLARLLQAEMQLDQYANLEQAGQTADERYPMSRIFVDLPVSDEDDEYDDDYALGQDVDGIAWFVQSILTESAQRLNPSEAEGLGEIRDRTKGPQPGRRVLVGGPGQGKTTLGQFVCQIFRTAILRDRPDYTLTPDVREILNGVQTWCQSKGYPLGNKRYPVRIVLSEFASELADPTSRITSVMTHITCRLKARCDADVDLELLRDWLKNYPWLVIFDGLDEVPASGNRGQVMQAISDFRIEIANSDADVLVIGTTRPQGYNDEFAPVHALHQRLVLLSPSAALEYGEHVAKVRFAGDEQRQEKVVRRLRDAAGHKSTARLMKSPLQVTIMTLLVDKKGKPPEERWSLFSAYYTLMYEREIERDNAASQVLRDYQSDVEEIHRTVAVTLQTEAESAGASDAMMSRERFREIVQRHLTSEHFLDEEISSLTEQIAEAAETRLVFLAPVRDGRVGFEIRSLQEFMAAEALMTARDDMAAERLAAVAPSASWRNVVLFAVGRCFARDIPRRDTILTLCSQLNELDDVYSRFTLAGSRLALDILEEGTVRKRRKYAPLFARVALRLLRVPLPEAHTMLARIYSADLEQQYKEEIADAFNSAQNPGDEIGSWSCILQLAADGVEWAAERALGWPADTMPLAVAWACLDHVRDPERRLTDQVLRLSARSAPATMVYLQRRRSDSRDLHIDAEWWEPFFTWLFEPWRGRMVRASLADFGDIGVRIAPLNEKRSLGRLVDVPSGPGWNVVAARGDWSENPSLETAAQLLHTIADNSESEGWIAPERLDLPWPLVTAVKWAKSPPALRRVADEVGNGTWGQIAEWRAAEEGWVREMPALTKIFGEDVSGPFPLGRRCPPALAIRWLFSEEPEGALTRIPDLCAAIGTIKDPSDRGHSAELILQMVSSAAAEISGVLALDHLLDIVEMLPRSSDAGFNCVQALPAVESDTISEETIKRLDEMVRTGRLDSALPWAWRLRQHLPPMDPAPVMAEFDVSPGTVWLAAVTARRWSRPFHDLDEYLDRAPEEVRGTFAYKALRLYVATGDAGRNVTPEAVMEEICELTTPAEVLDWIFLLDTLALDTSLEVHRALSLALANASADQYRAIFGGTVKLADARLTALQTDAERDRLKLVS